MSYIVKNCPAYILGCELKDRHYPYKVCGDKKNCVINQIVGMCRQKINFNENLVKKENIQVEKIILEILDVEDKYP